MTLDVHLRHAFAGFTLDVAFTAPAGVTARGRIEWSEAGREAGRQGG